MSLTIGLTTLFGAAAGGTIGTVYGYITQVSGGVFGSLNPKATALAGAILLGSAGWYAGNHYEDQQPTIDNITKQQAEKIAECHTNTPEGFEAKSGINKDGTVSCTYIQPR